MSHPTWVCGLKPLLNYGENQDDKSHPTWVCGLKPTFSFENSTHFFVTPYVGVWIETPGNTVSV